MQKNSAKSKENESAKLDRQVTVRVTDEIFQAMEIAAKAAERDVADWIRLHAIRPALINRFQQRRKRRAPSKSR